MVIVLPDCRPPTECNGCAYLIEAYAVHAFETGSCMEEGIVQNQSGTRPGNLTRDLRQARQAEDTHLMPTRSPSLAPALPVPFPTLTTNPTPSWPPTWPCCVADGRCAHYQPQEQQTSADS